MGRDDASRQIAAVTDISHINLVGAFCSITRIVEHQNVVQVNFNSHRRIQIKRVLKKEPFLMVKVENLQEEAYEPEYSFWLNSEIR